MNGESLSRALNSLPEEMIEAAMVPAPGRRRPLWRPAACAAVLALALLCGLFWPTGDGIKTAPGILTIKAYALDSSGEIVSVPAENVAELPYSYHWSAAVNCVPGLPLTLSVPDREDISFDVTVNGGGCMRWRGWIDDYSGPDTELPANFTLDNNSTIYWRCWYSQNETVIDFEGDHAYIDIIVYEQEHIIGYTVVKISRVYSDEYGKTYNFTASLMASVSFQTDAGQDVTKEYVRNEIQEVKSAHIG